MSKLPDVTLDRIFAAMERDTSPAMDTKTRVALERLIQVAQSDTGQSRHIAKLLLAWWDAGGSGGFDLTSFWNIDDELVIDSLEVIKWVSGHRYYPDTLGYAKHFETIWKAWGSEESIH
ncbi:hypothetical protein LRS11_18220 [Pseudomonas sp. J452]|uniref:DUF7673 family protein n=1 Tax=Pseudomonas sp. J452 TaxID=2898441 RepID=UPI0021AE298E|nr:hypothetical protein [Pseudomonas sp. J452]UUY07733.1 hypothetical protein LRS11_18220 [Pseudomonas sp. J452]